MSLILASKPVGAIGFGAMSLTNYFKSIPEAQAIATLKAALEAGCNFWNGGWFYGTPDYNSLHLFKAYFERYPEDVSRVVISIKACFDMKERVPLNHADEVREEIERCLAVADGTFKIDIFQPARLDPDVSVEETVTAIAEFVKAGRIGGIGLSECSAESVRKAQAVHPIAAVEIELSLFETSVLHNGVAMTCKKFGVPLIAYSPLGRGFLTGQLKKYEDLEEKDFRKMMPKFYKENFDQNVVLVAGVEQIAQRKGATTGQVAISWILTRAKAFGVKVVPIPGTSRPDRVAENVKQVELSDIEIEEIDAILESCEVAGGRYPAGFEKYLHV